MNFENILPAKLEIKRWPALDACLIRHSIQYMTESCYNLVCYTPPQTVTDLLSFWFSDTHENTIAQHTLKFFCGILVFPSSLLPLSCTVSSSFHSSYTRFSHWSYPQLTPAFIILCQRPFLTTL